MKKEEYLEQIAALRDKINAITDAYINDNEKYPVGTRVKVTGSNGKSRIGIVKGSKVSEFDSDVVPIIKMESKDGKETMRTIVVYPGDKIEVL